MARQSAVDSSGPAKPAEKRKVDGSTPPLTTSSGEHCDLWQVFWVTIWVTNIQFRGNGPQSTQYGRKVPSPA